MAYDTVAQGHDSPGTTASPNEIAIWIYMGHDDREYTVPTGKIFKGWLISHDSSTSPAYTYTPGTASKAANTQMGHNGAAIGGTFYHTSTGSVSYTHLTLPTTPYV